MITIGVFNLVDAKPAYEWTTDHMQVGVRWQPSASRPLNNAYELTRPILEEHSSYVMFWVAWPQIEPNAKNCDYQKHPSGGLKMFDEVVSAANRDGLFVEFVFMVSRVGQPRLHPMGINDPSPIISVVLSNVWPPISKGGFIPGSLGMRPI